MEAGLGEFLLMGLMLAEGLKGLTIAGEDAVVLLLELLELGGAHLMPLLLLG